MQKGTILRNGDEVMEFLRIEPIFHGLNIVHYIFKKNGREVIYPSGEWTRIKKGWVVCSE